MSLLIQKKNPKTPDYLVIWDVVFYILLLFTLYLNIYIYNIKIMPPVEPYFSIGIM